LCSDIQIRVYALGMGPRQLESIQDLVGDLRGTDLVRSNNLSVEFDYDPDKDRPKVPSVIIETLAIYIGTSIASGLIGAVVNDVYKVAKKWVRERRGQQKSTAITDVPVQRIEIIGPDGKELISWSMWELDDPSCGG
jgi:hypothetical protein